MKPLPGFSPLLLVVYLFFAPIRVLASPILSISGPPVVPLGSSFTIDVNISNVDDLYAFQFDIGFDPVILKATAVSEGPFLSGAGATFFIPGDIDDIIGSITANADTLLSAISGANGYGTLLTIRFSTIGSGSSDLTLSSPILLDSTLAPVIARVANGSVAVESSSVPEPSSSRLNWLIFAILTVRFSRLGRCA